MLVLKLKRNQSKGIRVVLKDFLARGAIGPADEMRSAPISPNQPLISRADQCIHLQTTIYLTT